VPIQGAKELAKELAAIRKGAGKPIYLVHGSEGYLVRSSADALARALAERSGAEVVRVDAAGRPPEAVLEPVVSLGLFASARVALVTGFGGLLAGDAADRMLASLDAGLGAGSAVVFAAAGDAPTDKVDKRLRGYKGLAARGVVLEMNRQTPEDLEHWLAEQASKEGKKLDAEAARLLLARTGPDMGALRSELEKALLYCLDRDRIRVADLERLVGKTREDAVWDVGEAIAKGDAARARDMLKELAASGTHPLVVLTLLVRQARHLLQARLVWEEAGRPPFRDFRSFQARVTSAVENGLFGKGADDVTSIHPFAAFKRFEAARRAELPALRGMLARLRQADLDAKTGAAGGVDEVVEELVVVLAAGARRAA